MFLASSLIVVQNSDAAVSYAVYVCAHVEGTEIWLTSSKDASPLICHFAKLVVPD